VSQDQRRRYEMLRPAIRCPKCGNHWLFVERDTQDPYRTPSVEMTFESTKHYDLLVCSGRWECGWIAVLDSLVYNAETGWTVKAHSERPCGCCIHERRAMTTTYVYYVVVTYDFKSSTEEGWGWGCTEVTLPEPIQRYEQVRSMAKALAEVFDANELIVTNYILLHADLEETDGDLPAVRP
jgi:hypothetical protein